MLVPSIGPVIRGILIPFGFGPSIDRHTAWFAGSPLLDAHFTDTVLGKSFSSAYTVFTSGIFGNQILAPLVNLVEVVLGESLHFWVLLIPAGMCGIAWLAIDKIRKRQQADFDKKWENGLREQYLGGFLYTSSGDALGQPKSTQ